MGHTKPFVGAATRVRTIGPGVQCIGKMFAVALLLILGASTARADGYVIAQPTPSSSIMADQRAILIYRTGHEDLIISIDLDMRSVQEVPDLAWVIPVPSLPDIHVTDNALFDELDRLSAPEIVYQTQGEGGLGPAVTAPTPSPTAEVLERTQVGVYDVAVLASSDGGALHDWLAIEGFGIPAELQPVLDAYLGEQWVFVAMRIAPDADQNEISSSPPVWLSFDAPRMVYPVRLTGVRSSPLGLRLYILWDHRATLEGFATEFAGTVQVDARDASMASILNRSFYLSKLFDPDVTPAQMASDFYPSQAPTDEPYREQVVQTTVSSEPASGRTRLAALFGLWWIGLVILLVAIGVAVWVLRRRR